MWDLSVIFILFEFVQKLVFLTVEQYTTIVCDFLN
jgi:hypothetical protein